MNPITISAVTTHIVNLFEGDELLRDVWLLGEVSNWKKATSSSVYFSLKNTGDCAEFCDVEGQRLSSHLAAKAIR